MMIEALYDFIGQTDHEASFSAGQVFVVTDQSDPDWFEVQIGNQMYGMVPRNYFCNVDQEPAVAHVDEESSSRSRETVAAAAAAAPSPDSIPLAVLLYDFRAEGEGELDATKGEHVEILAHSEDWFMARLVHQPEQSGLVPKSFVDVINGTDLSVLPNLEAWYEGLASEQQQSPADVPSSIHRITSILVPTFQPTANDDGFTFSVHVEREGGIKHIVHRTYEHFYALQKALLKAFPKEAGRFNRKSLNLVVFLTSLSNLISSR